MLIVLYVRNITIRLVIELYSWMKSLIYIHWRVLDLVVYCLYAKLQTTQQWIKLLNANLSNNQRLKIESIWDTTHWIHVFHSSNQPSELVKLHRSPKQYTSSNRKTTERHKYCSCLLESHSVIRLPSRCRTSMVWNLTYTVHKILIYAIQHV